MAHEPYEDYTLLTIAAFDHSNRRPWVFLIDARTNIALRGWPEHMVGRTRDDIILDGMSVMRWMLPDGSDSAYPRVDEMTVYYLHIEDNERNDDK